MSDYLDVRTPTATVNEVAAPEAHLADVIGIGDALHRRTIGTRPIRARKPRVVLPPGRPLMPTPRPTLDILRSTPLFAGLDDEAAAELRDAMVEVSLARKQVLFGEGDVGDRLYIIVEGKMKLSRAFRDGRSNVLCLLGPEDMFGESSLFDAGPRTATASAVTDVRLYSLSLANLEPWLRQRPEIAMALLAQLSRRLRRSNIVVGDLAMQDTPGRVAKMLLELASRFGVPTKQGIHVGHDLTQRELAELAGSSRETVNKVLAEFACRGWLRLAPRAVILVDLERLRLRAH